MKFNSINSALIISFAANIVAGAVPGNAQGGRFRDTCSKIGLFWMSSKVPNHVEVGIRASCKDGSGDLHDNVLLLGRCITNVKGTTLKWQQEGKFDESCFHCELTKNEGDSVDLTCSCFPTQDVRKQRSTINLNDRIRNEDGKLWCGEVAGKWQ